MPETLIERLLNQPQQNIKYGWSTNCNALLAEAAAALASSQSRISELRALLREVEWSGTEYQSGYAECPSCHGRMPGQTPRPTDQDGHAPDCVLLALGEG